jgi:TonB family protein
MLENQEHFDLIAKAPDRRTHVRIQLRSLAYLELDPNNGGVILDISEGGLAIQAAETLTGLVFPRMRFRLPQSETWIEVSGKLIWQGKSRKEAGIELVDLNQSARQQISRWAHLVTFRPSPPPNGVSGGSLPKQNAAQGSHPAPPAFSAMPAAKGLDAVRFASLSYQPTAFKEQTGRGWFAAMGALLSLLAVGIVMAVGPANVKSLLLRRAPSGADLLPPPRAASEETAPPPPATSDSGSPTASAAEAVPLPDRRSDQAPPDATISQADRKSASGASQNSPETHRADREEIETPEEAEAKVRQFQLEHSRTTPSPPAPFDRTAMPSWQGTSAPPASPASALASPRSHKLLDAYTPAPSEPTHVPTPHGTVAISSHFQSVWGEDWRPGDSLQIGQLASFSQPNYPTEATRARVEGIVMLHVLVNPMGTVESVRLLNGPPLLVPAAINAVRRWRYRQTVFNGRAVGSLEDVTVAFRLGNRAASPR